MNKTLIAVQDINNNLDKIAKAVTSVLKGNNKDELDAFYNSFYDKLKDCKYFIFNNKTYCDRYEKEINELFDRLNSIIGYDVKKYYFNESKSKIMSYTNDKNINVQYSDEVIEIYNKRKKLYTAFAIDCYVLAKIYTIGGIDKVKEVDDLINKINRKTTFYDLKSLLSGIKEYVEINKISKEVGVLCEKYKISNINDLLHFNTEIDSFFVNLKNMDEKQKEIIENNKKRFRSRINANDEYMLSYEEGRNLKKRIEKIFNSNVYEQIITNSNLPEMLEINNIKLKDIKLKEIVLYYIHLSMCNACQISFTVKDKNVEACFFKESLLKTNILEKNITVLHECIHLLQSRKHKGDAALSVYCRNMTEAITEYFAIKAVDELKYNIFTSCDYDFSAKYQQSAYCCMLPLVEELLESDSRNDIIDGYIYNETRYLADKIGGANLDKIKCCFDSVFESRNCDGINEIVEYNLKALRKTIASIKKSKRYNVK